MVTPLCATGFGIENNYTILSVSVASIIYEIVTFSMFLFFGFHNQVFVRYFGISFGITAFGLNLALLASLITLLSQIYAYRCFEKPRETYDYLWMSNLANLILILFFLMDDILVMYILFEAILIPMFLIIGIYGSRERRIHASLQMFFYTVLGSFFMLFAIIYLFIITGTTSLQILRNLQFNNFTIELFVWLALFFPLGVKIPLVPVHIWLPEAHVEAPTIGSVFLAALVLKMGGFGIIKLLLPVCPNVSTYLTPVVATICIVGMAYAGFSALRQVDMKKIIAYSSVVHMSYATLGFFNFDVISLSSAIFAQLAHGVISAGLFFAVGFIYDRFKTRSLYHYRGLARLLPTFTFPTFVLFLANFAFPGTIGFPSELGIFISLFFYNIGYPILLGFPLILNSTYNIWLVTRVLFGAYNKNLAVLQPNVIGFVEKMILYILAGCTVVFGLIPNCFLLPMEAPVLDLVRFLAIKMN